MARPPTAQVSWILLLVLIAAIAIGATASILVSPSSSHPASSSTGPTPEVILPVWVFVASILGVLVAVVVGWIILRLDSSGKGLTNNTFVSILFAIAIISLFIIGLRVLGIGGPAAPATGGSSSTNPTSPTTPVSPTTNVTLVGPGGFYVFPSLPSWLPLAVLVFVAIVAVAVAVPRARRYLEERRADLRFRHPPTPEEAKEVRAALSRASAELDLGGDPRAVILALYTQMLGHLRPMVGSVETATPEEIRAIYLVRLGVRPEEARTLTRLFEEARYSLHPMGPEESARAQAAVRATIDDLDRRSSAS